MGRNSATHFSSVIKAGRIYLCLIHVRVVGCVHVCAISKINWGMCREWMTTKRTVEVHPLKWERNWSLRHWDLTLIELSNINKEEQCPIFPHLTLITFIFGASPPAVSQQFSHNSQDGEMKAEQDKVDKRHNRFSFWITVERIARQLVIRDTNKVIQQRETGCDIYIYIYIYSTRWEREREDGKHI